MQKHALGPTNKMMRWGLWERRICVRCLCEDARWMPGVTEDSAFEARDAMRPVSVPQMRRTLKRDARLGAILYETRDRLRLQTI